MSRFSKNQFQNILFTLKRYQDNNYELLYISSEIKNIIQEGDKFYKESFFNEIFPTLPKNLFEFLYTALGTGERFICPLIVNKTSFLCVQVEGYVIAQEDKSYLINALISLMDWQDNVKFSWLVNGDKSLVFSDVKQEKPINSLDELIGFLSKKFDFVDREILRKFPSSEEIDRISIFPNHLYLVKKPIGNNFSQISLEYAQQEEQVATGIGASSTDLIFYEYFLKEDMLQMSGAIEKLLGYSKSFFENFTSKDWEKLVHPEDLHAFRNNFGRVGRMVYRILHKNDKYIFLEDEITKVDKNGNLILGFLSDITALKEIERDLINNKNVLDELTGVVPGMVYLLKANPDHSHNFIFISEGCRQLTELEPEMILESEENLAKLIHEEDREHLYSADRNAYLTDSKFESYFRIITPSGKEKWVYGASNRLKKYENDSIWAGFFVDFTYTKQKEIESSLHLNRYKTLFKENPLPIFQYDHNGIILDVNKKFLSKIDIVNPDRVIGKNLFDLLGNNPIKKAYQDSIEKGYGSYEGPYVSYFNNRLYHLRMTSKEIEKGKTYQAILEDISEQEYVHNVISQLTEKTSKFSGKQFFDELTKFLGEKLHMDHCFIAEIKNEEQISNVISYFKKGERGELFTYNLENTPCLDCMRSNEPFLILSDAKNLYPKDVGLQKLNISTYMGVPITDLNKNRLGILVLMDENQRPYNMNLSGLLKVLADRIGAEISRLNYEKRLLSSELLFRSIAENFPKGTVEVLNKKLMYVYADGKEFQLMGINPKVLIGTPHLSKYESYISKEVRKYLDRVLQGESVMFEVIIGDQYYLKSGVPLVNNQGEIDRILLVTQNITETKQAEEEREQLIRDLKSQNEELQRFAYITSHNLRAPIVNISSLLELYDEGNPSNPENREVIDNLKVSTTILNSTLEDLIEVVSIKKNKIPKVELIDFKQLTLNVERSLSKQIIDSKAEIHKNFSDAPSINYIYSHLENFLINLMTNAIKYKHPDRNPVILIKTSIEDNYTVLTFEDNGIGIDLERYGDRLFGLYQRFHSHVEGKGLGLYLVREQIRAHDGNLKVDSVVGKGTTFHIYLRNLKSSSNKSIETIKD
ncbi:PAS domain-containing protein [Cyclobacteriaceae bacterium YHN15]|jgi:PAS domain S-box-containing protein|nr:PAS domain-containing protein [Cyclobacteriaceae bacterium YHN15]